MLGSGTLVGDEADRNVTVTHGWSGRVGNDGEVEAIQLYSAVLSLVNMERHCKVAIALCVLPRQIAGRARTEVVAAARLHILTADPPLGIRHENPPLLLVSTSDSGNRVLQVCEPDNLPSPDLTAGVPT